MKFKVAFQVLAVLTAIGCTEVNIEDLESQNEEVDVMVYGTDMGMDETMYQTTFRILETEDEHFYDRNISSYHWAMHGFGLSNDVLEKVYHTNARRILGMTYHSQQNRTEDKVLD